VRDFPKVRGHFTAGTEGEIQTTRVEQLARFQALQRWPKSRFASGVSFLTCLHDDLSCGLELFGRSAGRLLFDSPGQNEPVEVDEDSVLAVADGDGHQVGTGAGGGG